jgi:hypothetical protein
MRSYLCRCGNTLFFDNTRCLACGGEAGFCPGCQTLVPLLVQDTGAYRCGNPTCGAMLAKCQNYSEHAVCNRCVFVIANGAATIAEEPPAQLCDCCRFNRTIPDLTVPGNPQKWYRLEAAKRRLFYDLNQLGLPYGTASDGCDPPLAFDFKADVIPKNSFWRKLAFWSNHPQSQTVYTGHEAGTITINIREADDVERERLRVDFGEAQRTLLGHFRHEIGHYWDVLVRNRREAECQAVFGDHNRPTYAEALDNHYKNGPAADWALRHVSAYASMHPWEDFAETWATYLDMVSELDTAHHVGFGGESDPVHADLATMIAAYQRLGIALNELNRSLGLMDAVPEVIVSPVIDKLHFIHELVHQGRAENGALQMVTP